MSDNPFMAPIFWLLKWCLIIALPIIAIAMVLIGVADSGGAIGVVVFLALIIGGVAYYFVRKLPERKREV
jgi:uncharacterized membrane protein